jgi:signal peptidase
VIGVPQFKLPKLGYVSDFIQNPPGMYITIAGGVVLILVVFLPDLIAGKKKENEPKTESAETPKEGDNN